MAKLGFDFCDLDHWPLTFVWISFLWMVINPENFMIIWWWEHSENGVTDRRTDRRTDWTIHRTAWQLKKHLNHCLSIRTKSQYRMSRQSGILLQGLWWWNIPDLFWHQWNGGVLHTWPCPWRSMQGHFEGNAWGPWHPPGPCDDLEVVQSRDVLNVMKKYAWCQVNAGIRETDHVYMPVAKYPPYRLVGMDPTDLLHYWYLRKVINIFWP